MNVEGQNIHWITRFSWIQFIKAPRELAKEPKGRPLQNREETFGLTHLGFKIISLGS